MFVEPTAQPQVSVVDLDASAETELPKEQLTTGFNWPQLPWFKKRSTVGSNDIPATSPKNKLIIAAVAIPLLVLVILGTVIGVHATGVIFALKTEAQLAQVVATDTYQAFKAQDLPGAQTKLSELDLALSSIKVTYTQLSYARFIPIANNYYADGLHGLQAAEAGLAAAKKSVAAIEPYSVELGFAGEGTFTGGTAEERVRLILETLQKIQPILDEIAADIDTMNQELAYINPNRYPEAYNGTQVRSRLVEGKELAANAGSALANYRPIIEMLPELAGASDSGRKKYLVLMENSGELRPTGGFLTAYAVIFVENGKVTPEKSDDIYELDKKFNQKLPIPTALGRYLTTEKNWNLRDMNVEPDLKLSMDNFLKYYATIKSEPQDIDGVIVVDTHLLTKLLEVVGPIEIPGYGTFSALPDSRCDCPQIIYALSEIITRPTPYLREDRKGILGPLMKEVLGKIYSSPRTYMADLFAVGIESIEGRHLQMYMLDDTAQQAVESINAGGRMTPPAPNQDFFGLVNANLGGAKSYFFITYDVVHEVSEPTNGQITRTTTITYKNNRRGDNCNLEAGLLCLNSTLRDWTRIYLPEGSQLVEAQGFKETPQSYAANGFTVIDGFFILEPNSQAKLKLTYTVPFTAAEYSLNIWKQGGIATVPTIIDVAGSQEELIISKDTKYNTSF